eukprot:11023002-Heterocapsa_arctica.AAC.1
MGSASAGPARLRSASGAEPADHAGRSHRWSTAVRLRAGVRESWAWPVGPHADPDGWQHGGALPGRDPAGLRRGPPAERPRRADRLESRLDLLRLRRPRRRGTSV